MKRRPLPVSLATSFLFSPLSLVSYQVGTYYNFPQSSRSDNSFKFRLLQVDLKSSRYQRPPACSDQPEHDLLPVEAKQHHLFGLFVCRFCHGLGTAFAGSSS
ncbi:uncharacterized protein BO66DRAFT_387162 [Aspergillus aculeatinus CBS 121060]|uniref:Uncharacterized protein n=1 Tax=Aspergillus aculeatinus CBS 121060 TaxID=1448322 RepID=A0ACD1HN18_9EURO|nr:hypothetical protein BO66DRAFT_387162 [Aspergillus aculeatinus CBS 121060]RAH75218.1 hypothetical protein BO66DRAFT_387162 [Aspergillus aculeatinus CBS 121060]